VYAPDTIGDLGKSVARERITQPGQYVDWLIDLFEALNLRQVHVAGMSMGGYLAMRLALACLERVNRLVLMSPACLLPLRPSYLLRMAFMFLPIGLMPLAAKQKLLMGTGTPAALPVVQQMLTPADFRYTLVQPPTLTDADLQRVSVPTLLLLGDREVVYDYRVAARRASAQIPGVKVQVLPGAGHALNIDQPDVVNGSLLAFLLPNEK
jgi:pimeloyl-ACP methyl ester carboxylesterase